MLYGMRMIDFKKLAGLVLSLAVIVAMIPAFGTAVYGETEAYVTKDGFKVHLWIGEDGASVVLEEYSGTGGAVKLPDSVTYDGKTYDTAAGKGYFSFNSDVFKDNKTITKIAVPKGYEYIGSDAFKGCTALQEIALGDSVSDIGPGAFAGCPATTYYFKGDSYNFNPDNGDSGIGIGTDSSGNPISGVIVWTEKGSPFEQAINSINENRPADKKITIKYADDPYSKNTVGTESGSGSEGSADNSGDDPGSPSGGTENIEQKGEDGTPYGKGASAKVAEKAITKYAKETDPKGTVFGLLQAKATKLGKTSVTLTWKKMSGAKKYVVYGNACGTKNKMMKLTTTAKNKLTFKKVNKKKVRKGTYYKFTVIALDKNNKVVSTSKMVHVATPGGKVGNHKSVTIKARVNAKGKSIKSYKALSKTVIRKGKSITLKATANLANKKLKVKNHRKVVFESSNTKIATVTAKGKVKAKAKGTCYIYAYAQNGVSKKIKITVK